MSSANIKVRVTIFVLLAASILLLGGGFVVAGQTPGVAIVAASGLAWAGWLVQNGRRWTWAPSALSALLILSGAAVLLQSEQALVWVYPGVVGVLATWDLSLFSFRLHSGASVIAGGELVAAHFRRIGLLVLLALAGLAIYLNLEASFDFERALFLGALLIFGASALARWLLRESD